MRTFAQKPETTQQTTSAKSTKTGRSHIGQSHLVSSILHLQRTIGNQAAQRLPQAKTENNEASSTAIISTGFTHDFSRVPVHGRRHSNIQPKLRVGTPGDKYEQEADRVAERVMRMPDQPFSVATVDANPHQIQLTCDECKGELQRQVADEQEAILVAEEKKLVQAKETPGKRPVIPLDVQPRIEGLRGGGHSLPRSVRNFFEPRFGHDFSQVRIHSDGKATKTARSIQARAFTIGNDIVFGAKEYAPDMIQGKKLLAHELTHVIQQKGRGLQGFVQADFAIEPTTPTAAQRTLSATEIQDAITFNTRMITDAQEIEMLRDILGLSKAPVSVNADFVQAVANYQVQYGLTPDGKVGGRTRRRLSREILAEVRFLGFTNLGGLATGVALRTQLNGLISAGNTNYATFRARIRAATVLQRDVILAEPAFLTRMRNHLTTWNDFARCVELLGRRAPTHNQLIRRTVVRNALAAAWTASNPAVNPPVTTQHEEGGWVYLNLITNALTVDRQAAGAGAAINLAVPPIVANSIVVAKFHTHPNLGLAWTAGPSPQDAAVDGTHGVPDIVIGSNDVNAATFNIFASGPNRRLHLAGNQSLPGAAGGVAPQARADGSYDEQ